MSIYNSLNFIGEDKRVRRYLLPQRIVETGGEVVNAESLLKQKSMQIGLSEKEYTSLKNGESGENAYIILDFGIELHGGIRLLNYSFIDHVFDPDIRITFGESIGEVKSLVGEKGATNDHALRQFTLTLPWLSDQEYGQTGFRFVKIELLSANAYIQLKSAMAVSVMHDFEYKGSFSCSDKTINRIFDTAAYTCHLCLQNMVWDGIKRDRLVWIGDMMPESMTAHCIFGAVDIVEKSLEFVRNQTPLPGWMNNMPAYSMWWMMILKDWYMASGNGEFLNRQRDYALSLAKMLCDCVCDNGEDRNIDSYFLDWPTSRMNEAKNGVRALLKLSLSDSAYLARIFGEEELARECENRAALITGGSEHGGAKQIAAFLSLAGIMDSKKAAKIITDGGDKGFSTFLSYFILKAISLAGKDAKAISLMKKYYKAMLDKGATSFWEDYHSSWNENSGRLTELPQDGRLDIHGDFGDFCYQGLRHSLCHGWSAGPVPFIMETVLGVTILEPGCKALKIEPHLGSLKWAKGTYPTPYGTVYIEHTVDSEGKTETKVSAPDEVKIIVA